jgi:antitoxin (DNA-binding transcriptional repressor) of toxin-antitoxin stability system
MPVCYWRRKGRRSISRRDAEAAEKAGRTRLTQRREGAKKWKLHVRPKLKSRAREKRCVILVYTSMQSARVGIREFRENLASYIESSTPVAITRHGETVGFYVPARRKRQQADLDALRKAGEQLDALIAAAGVGEDELIDDFKTARRGAPRGLGPKRGNIFR